MQNKVLFFILNCSSLFLGTNIYKKSQSKDDALGFNDFLESMSAWAARTTINASVRREVYRRAASDGSTHITYPIEYLRTAADGDTACERWLRRTRDDEGSSTT